MEAKIYNFEIINVRQNRNDFFKPTFPPKNEQTNSMLLLWDLFCLFFGGNWRHQKYISKLTDLYQSKSGRSVFVDFFLKLLWDARKIMWSYYKISQSVCLSLFVQMTNKINFYFKQAGLPNLASNFFPRSAKTQLYYIFLFFY